MGGRKARRAKLPTYPLKRIHAEVGDGHPMPSTTSALADAVRLGYTMSEVRLVIERLTAAHFVKSMPNQADPTVWQDVYGIADGGRLLYIKFQERPGGGLVLVSFHET